MPFAAIPFWQLWGFFGALEPVWHKAEVWQATWPNCTEKLKAWRSAQ